MIPASAIHDTYYIFVALVYGCIAVICLLALFFGLRAKRNVKRERVTRLPDGLSPLDVQRIFIGKTYPRRITEALLTYWARRGYIKLKYVDRSHVSVILLEKMPLHHLAKAVFFDRGTYVRERKLFELLINKTKSGEPVNIHRPLFTKQEVKNINEGFAVREDEGVYSATHYTLKIITLILSALPFALCVLWTGLSSGNYVGFVLLGTATIGMIVLMFVRDMPIPFKIVWCGMWLGASVGGMIAFTTAAYDPFGLAYAAAVMLFLGAIGLRQFVDYREKNNLADYSDLVNYRKFLLFAPAEELAALDYSEALPFLHVFRIKWLAKRKYNCVLPPEMYEGEADGGLL